MKLRNKKTDEIVEANDFNIISDYNSLAELNEDWEDYEEPSEQIENIWTGNRRDKTIHIKCNSEEYAKKVILKLKAWKKLKDNGISFGIKTIDRKWYLEPKADPKQRTIAESQDLVMAINTIFGGENETTK